MSIFETATRKKIRFASNKGNLSVEQLWDVPLRSKNGFNLNEVAKAANREVQEIVEENFVGRNTPGTTTSHLRLELVKHVIAAKIAEETVAEQRVKNKIERQKLLRLLGEKQDGALAELSEEELQRRIEALPA